MAAAEIARAVLGICVFIGVAWLASERRRGFAIRPILIGVAAQFVLALLLISVPVITTFFGLIARGVDQIQSASMTGARFVFGYLSGGPQPFALADPPGSLAIFAFQSLPAIIVVSALSALLWHWRVLQWFVRGAAWLFGKLFGVSGPVGVSTSACIFVGMIEAPLLIRPLLPRLSRGELFIIMVDGMAVLAGSMMIMLGAMLAQRIPNAFSHLLIASIISTPMAIGLARAIVPSDPAMADEQLYLESQHRSSMDALAQGALLAVKMAASIAALLIVFIGLIALVDQLLTFVPYQGERLTVAGIFGELLAPVAWLMGVPSSDLHVIGALLGTKVALNEVVAYGQLLALPPGALSSKGELIATYALASFGNIGSVAILIGTLGTMAPEKGGEIAQLGFKALLAATLTTCLTGTIVGILSSVSL